MRIQARYIVLTLASLALIPTAQGFAQSSARQVSNDEGGDDPARVICRRSVDTGSLVKGRRQCFTRAQWDRIAEAAQKNATQLQENNRGRPSGE